jgi:hypothetical protein
VRVPITALSGKARSSVSSRAAPMARISEVGAVEASATVVVGV